MVFLFTLNVLDKTKIHKLSFPANFPCAAVREEKTGLDFMSVWKYLEGFREKIVWINGWQDPYGFKYVFSFWYEPTIFILW